MQILFATSNPHKLEEVRAILADESLRIVGLDDLEHPAPPEPAEDGDTFEANARIKAVFYARASGRICLADDSGLEVDALGGEPGVHSARYAEVDASRRGEALPTDLPRAERDRMNNELLLRRLAGVPFEQRAARFVCAMCLADPEGRILAETRGTFEGIVADAPRGTNGFGYDPLLHLPDAGRTSAELSPQEKNARSHRAAAARAMAKSLRVIHDSGARHGG